LSESFKATAILFSELLKKISIFQKLLAKRNACGWKRYLASRIWTPSIRYTVL